MTDLARLAGAFGFALVAVLLATPVAIRVAARTGFYDAPVGYKAHAAPTPYLGGAAVVLGFLLGALAFGSGSGTVLVVVAGAVLLWAVGTVDDRVGLPAGRRVLAEVAAACVLWATGHGWSVFHAGVPDLVLTIVWIVGLVNAFNLMDNMDGAASSVASVSAAGVGGLALIDERVGLAAAAFALSGACLGFLPYNLRSPARIFLGDGGSMPVGFVVAATLMTVGGEGHLGATALLGAIVLVGLPVLDTTLVVVSRRRRGISILTGGRDHLTHRLLQRLPTARAVAVALGIVQAGLCAAVIGAAQLGSPSLAAAAGLFFALGATAIGMLETGHWLEVSTVAARTSSSALARAAPASTTAELGLAAVIGATAGGSAFFSGFYDLGAWGPIALGVLGLLVGVAFGIRSVAFTRIGLVALVAAAALWVWSLASTAWAESNEQAMIEAGRWLLYLALLGLLLVVVRGTRAAKVVLGSVVVGLLAVGAYLAIRLWAGDAELFLAARLNGPLGYVNGQASYLLLAFWPLLAVAERARQVVLRAGALGCAVMVVGLALLTETRAILPAVLLSLIVILAAVPGRERRLWALAVIALAVGVVAPSVVHVYTSAAGGHSDPSRVADAMGKLVIAAVAAAVAWGVATSLPRSAGTRARLASRIVLVSVVTAGVAIAAIAVGNPVQRVRSEANAFVHLKSGSAKDSRFLSGGGNRYDYWRIAVDEFKGHPLTGVGAGNFTRDYFTRRRTTEDIRQPHSVELQALAELGIVGAIVLAVFLTAVLAAFGRVARRARADAGLIGIAVAAGGVFLVWLVHTSVDWLHLLPGVTATALVAAAVLLNHAGPLRPVRGSRLVGAAAVVLAIAGTVTVGRLTLADHYRAVAADEVQVSPRAALDHTGTALALDGDSTAARYVQGAAYARLGDYDRARAALLGAIRLEPHNFVSWALLGDLAVRRGDFHAAREAYLRAARLNPRDSTLRVLARNPRSAFRRN